MAKPLKLLILTVLLKSPLLWALNLVVFNGFRVYLSAKPAKTTLVFSRVRPVLAKPGYSTVPT